MQQLAAAATALATRPKSYERFLIQAAACLRHDAREHLPRIFCPTLVLGGTEDGVVTAQACRELAEEIVGAELYLYEGLSHAFYEEAGDFQERVAAFCKICKAEEKD
jgi:pimeloyl-ACP methyl ester carboxylesterase